MQFVLKPSLEHRALAKIGISLWNQNDVRALISKFNSDNLYSNEKWTTIEEKVIEKVSQLSLLQFLKEKVLGCIKPIGLQIKGWIEFHYTHFDILLNLPAELCWTPEGTVDRKKTAEVLVKDVNLDITTRYRLACIYCLEDDIIDFWNSMSWNLRESVSYKWKFPVINFWSHKMDGRGLRLFTYRTEFQRCAQRGNKVASEYFLQKVNTRERGEYLVWTAKYVEDADTLFFLISKMNKKQQMENFKNNPYGVLKCVLQWPWQSFFIRTANCMWDFLSKEDCVNILTEILDRVRNGYKDWNYQKLFREFWQKSPNALRSLITNEIDKSLLLPSLFHIKDKEIIRLILKEATFAAKEKLIYSDKVNYFCKCYIHDNEWDFLEFCIRECLPSKNEMLKFKEVFEKRLMHSFFKEHFATKKQEWDQLFCISDDSICKYNKRSLEGAESSSSKRFSSLQ